MRTRQLLILLPTTVTLILLASYFWVPTYESQTTGNPKRLSQYVTASGGDAAILNPILYSDGPSGEIIAQVFDSLIDRNEHLEYRGRVAQRWRLYEHAYFYLNAATPTRAWGHVDGPALVSHLKAAFDGVAEWRHISAVQLLPADTLRREMTVGRGENKQQVTLEGTPPPRIRLTLNRVDQLLFDKLAKLLGNAYFDTVDATRWVTVSPSIDARDKLQLANQLLPTTEHNPIIEFHLRRGVRFHDGREVTATDVKFTYDAIMNPKNISPRVPDYEPVKQIDIIDPYTVRVTYKRLYSPALGTWGMPILPAHLLNADALAAEAKQSGNDPKTFAMRQSSFNRRPVGCGPFRFKEWKSDQFVRLVRNDDYWDKPPNYREYVMRIIPDVLTQEMEFYAGTVDDYSTQPHQVERLIQNDRFRSFSGLVFGYSYIAYNLRRPILKDARVRRALGMAIDTQKIIDYVIYGQGESITGPFPKQTDFYNHGIPPLPFDPDGAVRLLNAAGWKRGKDGFLEKDGKRFAFTLITNNGNPLRKAILAIAQDAWKKIGIQVETDLLEWSVFIEKRVNLLDFDAVILGWSMGIDPDLYQIWHSSQTGKYQLNFAGFSDPEADDLIVKIRREYDHAQQVAYCQRLHKIIADAQPYTFLYVGRSTTILDKRIVRKVLSPDGTEKIQPIVPIKTGNHRFHFNEWIKLPRPPVFAAEG